VSEVDNVRRQLAEEVAAWCVFRLIASDRERLRTMMEIRLKLECVAMPSVMVALPCTTDAQLLWQYAKILITMATGSVGVQFE